MSLVNGPSVHGVLAGCRIRNFTDKAADALAADAEHRLRVVLQEATKLMRHSKRSVLSCRDVSLAMRQLNYAVSL